MNELNPNPTAGTLLQLKGLTVRAAERVLLEDAEATFQAGKVTLIVGPSGAGKSVLLRIMAGLIGKAAGEIRVDGSVRFNGQETLGTRRRPPVGVVFQSFALFDELSPLENVRFAMAHRPGDAQGDTQSRDHDAAQLLEELRVPTDVRAASLSGGQRQRLAIARTLAYGPGVLLYDEPTSGLDAATAEQVARLIRQTHAAHPTTSVIVTHDYASLVPIADAVYLFDSSRRSLVPVPREQWPMLREMLHPATETLTEGEPSEDESSAADGAGGEQTANQAPRPTDLPGQSARTGAARSMATLLNAGAQHQRDGWLARACSAVRSFLEAAPLGPRDITALAALVPWWRSPAWGLRYLLHYLRLVAGPSAWVYIGLTGAIIGFVATYFTFQFFPFKSFTVPVLEEDLLKSLGFALYRILVPVLATILIAARCGAAVASDVGGKAYGQQLDALRTFGASPNRYLLTGIVYAFLIGTPVLVYVCYAIARYVSLMVFLGMYPDRGAFFWSQNFESALREPGQFFALGTHWLLAKVLICGLLVAWVAYFRGAAPKYSHRDVSAGITTTVLWGTLLVLIVHFVFAFLEF